MRGTSAVLSGDDRGQQMLSVVNNMLAQHFAARSRDATLSLPARVVLSPSSRLCAAESNQRTMRALLEERLLARGQRATQPLRACVEALAGGGDDVAVLKAAQTSGARDDDLVDALRAAFVQASHYFEFCSQLSAQWGVYATLSAAFSVHDASPAHHLLSLGTGTVQPLGFRARLLRADAALAPPPVVPFRLTRSVATMLSVPAIEGRLTAAAVATATVRFYCYYFIIFFLKKNSFLFLLVFE